MYSYILKGNEIFIKDINSDTVIVGYVSENQTIHEYAPKIRQAPYTAKSAPVVLRFPRIVDSFGNYVTIDIDNRVCRYTDDTQGFGYPTVTTQNRPIILTTYPSFPIYKIQDHQCAPFNPVYSAEDMVLGKPDIESEIIQAFNPHNSDDSKAYDEGENDGSEAKPDTATESAIADKETNESIPQNKEKSKRILEYDRYFTRENKIYSFFTTGKDETIDTILCNFAVYPDGIERIMGKNSMMTQRLRLFIVCGTSTCYITIQPECTDEIIKEIQKQIPQAYINPCEKNAAKQLSAYISMMYENCFFQQQ